MSEKISGYSSQWGNELSWNKEMLDTWLDTDHTQAEIRSRMDSLYRQFDRVVVVLEHTPQIADAALDDLNDKVTKIHWRVSMLRSITYLSIWGSSAPNSRTSSTASGYA